MIGGQTMIVFVGGVAFSVTRLNGPQWGYSIVLGFLSLPVGMIVRLIPDELIRRCIPDFFMRKRSPEVVVTDDDFEWNRHLLEIRNELAFIRKFRGGRLSNIKYNVTHPTEMFSRSRTSFTHPSTPDNGATESEGSPAPTASSRRCTRSRPNSAFGPAGVMAGIVAGSIGGWSPIGKDAGDAGSMALGGSGGNGNIKA
ncbi:plasma membrane calcium [Didymella glomerata]|uniref:Plasma membrane calcium n=1 Tax=Didymella glomerata TaxID=749621 RepID=A0A9W8WNJ8_9PLEO|nr:plasma membrane calcium [Didymella glomerata]